jgi:glycosyltransferase involved in cell wall biosynthesis
MRLQLIAKRDARMTGLRRYAETLRQHLGSLGEDVRFAFPPSQVPALGSRLARHFGWDLDVFFQSYPLRARFEPADLYHLTSENLATLLLFHRLRPSIVTVHALFAYLLRHDPELSMYEHPLHRWFDRLAVRGLHHAQAIIAVSGYVKSALVEQVGLPAGRIHVIPEAVDHDVFRPQPVPVDVMEKYGLAGESRYLLYVGSEQPRKNLTTLLRAFARLKRTVGDVRLVKVGQPEVSRERQKALVLIDQLGIEKDVVFCGHVGEDLPLFYNLAHLFVFPSRYEGFGFPPLEAMACGTPVICSNATSLPEVVGDAALLFDPLDEDRLVELMERLLADRDLREEYVRRGLARAACFHWSTTAQQTMALYRQVALAGG